MHYTKIMVWIGCLCMVPGSLYAKILSRESYERRLQSMNNQQLKKEYVQQRMNLTRPPEEMPENIEQDVTFTQKPEYKIDMFKAVVQEISNRLAKPSTIEEMASVADFFMKKYIFKEKKSAEENSLHKKSSKKGQRKKLNNKETVG